VVVLVDLPRLACSACQAVRQAEVAFAAPGRRCTRSFVKYVRTLRRRLTLLDLADHPGVGPWLVRSIEKGHLPRRFSWPKLKHRRRMAIDEVSFGRGRKFLTLVLDLESGAVLCEGEAKAPTPGIRSGNG